MKLVARHCNACGVLITWDAKVRTRMNCHRDCDGYAEIVPPRKLWTPADVAKLKRRLPRTPRQVVLDKGVDPYNYYWRYV